ncbi:hypothetical protein [Pseudonocardia nigra]|uniref:hypothetical protein n=1 Tax=Pseudonocardia nigra TaxID=1921578 RepID=UPI001C5D3E9C|nr:hypothetical protein [Pseudonocardia nigra]
MVRLGGAVVALEVAAVVVAYLAFGWPVLLVGAPLLVGTVLVFALVRASEGPRRKLQEQRAARWDTTAATPGGLMSGFFELSPQPTERPDEPSGTLAG